MNYQIFIAHIYHCGRLFSLLVKYLFISSGVFPLVSGKKKITKINPNALTAPKRKYKPDVFITSSRLVPNFVTMNAHNQLNPPAIGAMIPCASFGNSSAFIAQGIGP